MTNEELVQLIRSGEDPNGERMAELYQGNRGIIFLHARKYARGCCEIDDLMQEAFLILASAVETFDPNKDCSFLTWFTVCLRNGFMRYLDDNSTTVRLPGSRRDQIRMYRQEAERYSSIYGREPSLNVMAAVLGVSVDTADQIRRLVTNETGTSLDAQMLPGKDGNTRDLLELIPDSRDDIGGMLDDVFIDEITENIWGAVDDLGGEDAAIVREYYKNGRTLEEIGRALGLKRARVMYQKSRALDRLRKGDRMCELRSYLDYYSAGLSGTGLSVFQHSGTSATERAAIRMYA